MNRDQLICGSHRSTHESLTHNVVHEALLFPKHIHEGRAQQSLSFIAGMSCLLGGLEVVYEHYRGSYGQRIMYAPVVTSALATVGCLLGVANRSMARTVMPVASSTLLVNGVIGFFYHIRGVARKPGGWRIPVFNIVMGPPLFAPLLLGIGGYLGFLASFMRREDNPGSRPSGHWLWSKEISTGHFQKHMAIATSIAALLSGAEALYSHYKNNFRYMLQQISPLIIAPALCAVAILALFKPKAARKAMAVLSVFAIFDGTAGFFYHVRGVFRRPGGKRQLFYNIVYGPPVLAPLLFAAAGFLGLLACIMRREK
jgi:hypothetical protein